MGNSFGGCPEFTAGGLIGPPAAFRRWAVELPGRVAMSCSINAAVVAIGDRVERGRGLAFQSAPLAGSPATNDARAIAS